MRWKELWTQRHLMQQNELSIFLVSEIAAGQANVYEDASRTSSIPSGRERWIDPKELFSHHWISSYDHPCWRSDTFQGFWIRTSDHNHHDAGKMLIWWFLRILPWAKYDGSNPYVCTSHFDSLFEITGHSHGQLAFFFWYSKCLAHLASAAC